MQKLFLSFLLIFFSIIVSADPEYLDDLCYEAPVKDGFCGGIINFQCTITTPIRNRYENQLTNVQVILASQSMFSAFDDCGVDDSSGNCEDSSKMSMMAISVLNDGISYSMPDYNSLDYHTTYTKAMFSFMNSSHQWIGKYTKDGVEYEGIINPCTQNDEVYTNGIFDAWEKDISNRDITTKIVDNNFTLTLASLTDDFNSLLGRDVTILYDLYDYDTQQSVTNGWFEWEIKRLYPTKNVTFENILKAYKDVRVRFKYCQKEKCFAMLGCYNVIVDYDKCNNDEFKYVSSSDNFAIRPDKFAILTTNNLTKMRLNHDTNLTFKSLSFKNNLVSNYNEQTNNSFKIDININNNSKICTYNTINSNLEFDNGQKNITLDTFDIGEWNISIKEINGNEFAKVDANDTSNELRFISSSNKIITIIPNSFELNTILKNSNTLNNFTYLNDDLTQSADLNITLKALKWDNSLAKNYTKSCYAKDFNLSIDYNSLNVTPNNSLRYIKYKIVQLDKNISLDINSIPILTTLDASLFKDEAKGISSFQIKFNFDRDKTKVVNPFNFKTTHINIIDTDLINVDEYKEQNTTFIYARTHSARQSFINTTGLSKIYFEVYCYGDSCDKELLKDTTSPHLKYTHDIRWFINENHNPLYDGEVGNISQKYGDGVSSTTPTNENPSKVTFTYNEKYGYPFKTTMQNSASNWLIYNPNDANETKNYFQIEFLNIGKWTGEYETQTTTKDIGSAKINRRVIW